MPKLPPPDSIRQLEQAFDRFLFAPTRWVVAWTDKQKLSGDLAFTRMVADSVKRSVHDYFAPLKALQKAIGLEAKAAKPVLEEVAPTAVHFVDDVAHQHAGNAAKWAERIATPVSTQIGKN